MEPVTKLLSDLVAIPSVNPMGRGRTGKEYCEQSIAEFVAGVMKKASIDAEIQQVSPGRPNVIGVISAGAQETLMLEAHLDTVFSDSMQIDPFDPVVRDGKLYGRGACDTKGSVAAFLQAVMNSLKVAKSIRYNVVLLFVSDEEYRFSGAQYAVRHGLKADFGITGEPTQLRIVRAHKGVTRWKILTKGIAAHSAYPARGKNAIYAMAKVVERLERHAASLSAGNAHQLLGTPSLSVGVIEGGQAVNVVPDHCWIEIDRRTVPGETAQTVLDPIRSLLSDLEECEIREPHLSVAGMEVAEHAPIVQSLMQAVKSVCGEAIVEAAQYATDAGIYNSVGIPTVVFGPGDIAQAHTESEYIELQQLYQATAIIERVLTS
jgi:acetylornithine deacetylase/succinyl-diaminopimelate desuccinylase family protein